jgi:hypothetical protein
VSAKRLSFRSNISFVCVSGPKVGGVCFYYKGFCFVRVPRYGGSVDGIFLVDRWAGLGFDSVIGWLTVC